MIDGIAMRLGVVINRINNCCTGKVMCLALTIIACGWMFVMVPNNKPFWVDICHTEAASIAPNRVDRVHFGNFIIKCHVENTFQS